MDTRKVFAGVIVVIVIAVAIFSWNSFPAAKYIQLGRSDGFSKFIAVERIEVYDTDNKRVNFASMDQSKPSPSAAGYANSAGTGGKVVTMDGKMLGYYDDGAVALTPKVGPCVAFISSADVASAVDGYLVFTLEDRVKISRIDIYAPNDETARRNLERVKVVLWNSERTPIAKADVIIPASQSSIPPMVHHIRFT